MTQKACHVYPLVLHPQSQRSWRLPGFTLEERQSVHSIDQPALRGESTELLWTWLVSLQRPLRAQAPPADSCWKLGAPHLVSPCSSPLPEAPDPSVGRRQQRPRTLAGAALEEGPGGCTKGALFLTPLSHWALLWVLCQLRGLLPSANLAGLGAQKFCDLELWGALPGGTGRRAGCCLDNGGGARDVPKSTHEVHFRGTGVWLHMHTHTVTRMHPQARTPAQRSRHTGPCTRPARPYTHTHLQRGSFQEPCPLIHPGPVLALGRLSTSPLSLRIRAPQEGICKALILCMGVPRPHSAGAGTMRPSPRRGEGLAQVSSPSGCGVWGDPSVLCSWRHNGQEGLRFSPMPCSKLSVFSHFPQRNATTILENRDTQAHILSNLLCN